MTTRFYWQLDVAAEPERSEPRLRPAIGTVARDIRGGGINRYDYYAQVARAAAITGFDGLFIAHREAGDDSRIVAAAIAREAPRLQLITEFPASTGSAVYAAKQAVSFQRGSHDRLGWAIAPDADPVTRARHADPVAQDDLIARIEEFLIVARGVHRETPFDFEGRFFEVGKGGFAAPLNRVPFPPVFLSGASDEALALSARQADVHLFDALSDDELRDRIATLRALAATAGRTVGAAIVQAVAARESAADTTRLHAPATITGSYDEVADRLAARVATGVDHLILGGASSLEEACRAGEFLLPRLRDRLTAPRASAA